MTTALLWPVGVLTLMLALACRVAWVLWRANQHVVASRRNPDALAYDMEQTLAQLVARKDFNRICRLRDAAAGAFNDAEDQLERGVPNHQRAFIKYPEWGRGGGVGVPFGQESAREPSEGLSSGTRMPPSSTGLVAKPTDSIATLGLIALRYYALIGEAISFAHAEREGSAPNQRGLLRTLHGAFDAIEHMAADLLDAAEHPAGFASLAGFLMDAVARMAHLRHSHLRAIGGCLVPSADELTALYQACGALGGQPVMFEPGGRREPAHLVSLHTPRLSQR